MVLKLVQMTNLSLLPQLSRLSVAAKLTILRKKTFNSYIIHLRLYSLRGLSTLLSCFGLSSSRAHIIWLHVHQFSVPTKCSNLTWWFDQMANTRNWLRIRTLLAALLTCTFLRTSKPKYCAYPYWSDYLFNFRTFVHFCNHVVEIRCCRNHQTLIVLYGRKFFSHSCLEIP